MLKSCCFFQVIIKEIVKLIPEPVAKAGLDYALLKGAIPHLLYRTIFEYRKKECPPCQDATLLPVANEQHKCFLSTKPGPIADGELKMAEMDMKEARIIEAILMLKDVISTKQLMELDIGQYFESNRMEFRGTLDKLASGDVAWEQNILENFF